MGIRHGAIAVFVALCLAAIAALWLRGFNYALDFTGGTVVEIEFARPVDVEGVRKRLLDAGYESPVVQTFGSGADIVIRLQPREEDAQDDGRQEAPSIEQTGTAILQAAQTPDNPGRVIRSDFVGPQIGDELAMNGVYAAVFVLLGFLAYIAARFEYKFAVAAVTATFGDILLVCGWFAFNQHEFDLTVLAGILSVMGFSINDKIVVFDRVRENFRLLSKIEPKEVLNRSVNQTLSRTVITSFVAFLTVLALYIYGGASLKGMAESQMIGIVIGTLSSILVACPILLLLGVTKKDLMPKAKTDVEAELARRP
ncbi:protein translocase subunit SecF [Arenimonas fontis]|uniref:Protein-export membrane protein SecF n=1 Tax=Arenimonas fontis TaxID=2608255 RepID=A0A5B2Z8J4_9GAMM|nr:protein translocase subunit SecF [Arenimonas fontis]KAA2284217.1 protein translocase subunit SecF [Arenimonas fontis]